MRFAVIGGGPGAGAAALRLARGGADVSLFHPPLRGEKPCGGALPEHLLPQVEGFDPAPLPAIASPLGRIENAAGSSLEIPLPGLRIFRRGDFDTALNQAAVRAGARWRPLRVDRIEAGSDVVRLLSDGLSEEFDWVICADGARGLSRRTLELEPEGESVGLGASLRGIAEQRFILSFPDAADAYLWIFPRPGGVSVGAAYTRGTLSDGAARRLLDALLDRFLPRGWQLAAGPRYRYPIPVWGPWTLPAIRLGMDRRLLLVGDAAALADPLTREGIRYAALSGRWAAEGLLSGEPEGYADRVEAEFQGELDRALRARALFFEDRIAQWMVPLARHHDGVGRVLADLLACRQPYRGLRRRLVRAVMPPA